MGQEREGKTLQCGTTWQWERRRVTSEDGRVDVWVGDSGREGGRKEGRRTAEHSNQLLQADRQAMREEECGLAPWVEWVWIDEQWGENGVLERKENTKHSTLSLSVHLCVLAMYVYVSDFTATHPTTRTLSGS
jgi:hypothetical protein